MVAFISVGVFRDGLALHEAAEKGDLALVCKLLEGGAEVNTKDSYYGNTALMMADGLHPNAEGQKVIAELMYPHLKSYLDNRHFPHLEGTEK